MNKLDKEYKAIMDEWMMINMKNFKRMEKGAKIILIAFLRKDLERLKIKCK